MVCSGKRTYDDMMTEANYSNGSFASNCSDGRSMGVAAPFGQRHLSVAQERELHEKLNRDVDVRNIMERQGQGRQKVFYLEHHTVVEIANDVFGPSGWKDAMNPPQIVYQSNNDGRWSVGVYVTLKVTLANGASHEDVGWGDAKNMPDRGDAIEKAIKQAVSDARKRALRNFGRACGLSLYDKTFTKDMNVKKRKAAVEDCQLPTVSPSASASVSSSSSTTSPAGSPCPPGTVPEFNHLKATVQHVSAFAPSKPSSSQAPSPQRECAAEQSGKNPVSSPSILTNQQPHQQSVQPQPHQPQQQIQLSQYGNQQRQQQHQQQEQQQREQQQQQQQNQGQENQQQQRQAQATPQGLHQQALVKLNKPPNRAPLNQNNASLHQAMQQSSKPASQQPPQIPQRTNSAGSQKQMSRTPSPQPQPHHQFQPQQPRQQQQVTRPVGQLPGQQRQPSNGQLPLPLNSAQRQQHQQDQQHPRPGMQQNRPNASGVRSQSGPQNPNMQNRSSVALLGANNVPPRRSGQPMNGMTQRVNANVNQAASSSIQQNRPQGQSQQRPPLMSQQQQQQQQQRRACWSQQQQQQQQGAPVSRQPVQQNQSFAKPSSSAPLVNRNNSPDSQVSDQSGSSVGLKAPPPTQA